jgi:hypothetical protein
MVARDRNGISIAEEQDRHSRIGLMGLMQHGCKVIGVTPMQKNDGLGHHDAFLFFPSPRLCALLSAVLKPPGRRRCQPKPRELLHKEIHRLRHLAYDRQVEQRERSGKQILQARDGARHG